MIKMKLLFIFLCFCFTIGNAQNESETVYFFPEWKQGEVFNYKITKSQKMTEGGVVKKNNTAFYHAKLQVLEKNEDYYKLKWSNHFDFAQFNMSDEISKELEDKLIADVVYKAGLDGEFLEVLNWKELSQRLNNMLDLVVESANDSNPSKKGDIENLRTYMKDVFSVKENVEAIATKELQLLHNSFGGEFTVGEFFEYEEERPNPYGGNSIKAENIFHLEKSSSNKDNFILVAESSLNQEDAKNFVINFIEKMKVDDDDFEEFIKNSSFQINEHSEFEYSSNLKMVVRAQTSRNTLLKMKTEGGERTEVLQIELIK